MDAQGIAIGLVVFVLSCIIIWAISALTMREKTFEQAMEEQRGQSAALAQAKPSKEKAPKKKKKAKKSKSEENREVNNDVEDSGHATEEEHKMVQYELDPEIIEPQVAPVVEASPTGARQRKKKTKSILVNKDERGLVKVCTALLLFFCDYFISIYVFASSNIRLYSLLRLLVLFHTR